MTHFVFALGSNLGDKEKYLEKARLHLLKYLSDCHFSSIQETLPVDYLTQPSFLNQLGEIALAKIPPSYLSPEKLQKLFQHIETTLEKKIEIPKGPRTIDLDLLFWGKNHYCFPHLTIPHPRLFQRSFVLLPLKELQAYNYLKKIFYFPDVSF